MWARGAGGSHLLTSTASGSVKASAIDASHWGPVSDVLSNPVCKPGSCVARKINATRTYDTASAFRIGGANPLTGSRRFASALPEAARKAGDVAGLPPSWASPLRSLSRASADRDPSGLGRKCTVRDPKQPRVR